jgi:DNA adenine methylase
MLIPSPAVARAFDRRPALLAGKPSDVPGQAPLLRWAGSKKKLLPLLQRATPIYSKRYVEPFVGSGVLFLALDPARAVLSDINHDLIDTYHTVRSQPLQVWKAASGFDASEAAYYAVRALDPIGLSRVERAARFVYLNRFCFNGVYRTNREGRFNVSRGKGHLGIPRSEVFKAFAERLGRADLRCIDFETTLAETGAGDYIYLDPPYASSGNRDRGEYGPGSFKSEDLERLAAGLNAASERGAKVLLSYSDLPELIARLPGWQVRRLAVARNVAGFTSARRRAEEVLISNYSWR